jgi:hypothetical protein
MDNLSEFKNINEVVSKWEKVLDFDGLAPITDQRKRQATAIMLENQVKDSQDSRSMIFEADIPNISNDLQGSNSNLARFDPILISLVRRSAPMMIAFDVCGVQPMSGPTGLVFSLKSGYANTTAGFTGEALFNEANTAYSGDKNSSVESLSGGAYTANTTANDHIITGVGTSTILGETDDNWPQMGFKLEKTQVTAKTRRLKADFTVELAQDLKAINNLDAEQELSNILSTEIMFEQNREVIRNIYNVAKAGGTANTGAVNLAVDGGDITSRYFAEAWRGLKFLIDRDAIKIQKDTRRGRGNFVICDAETASALANIGILDYSLVSKQAALSNEPDETTSTFVGMLGNMKVFVDPYIDLGKSFYVVGYKGNSPYDAGMFFCPYVGLQMFKVTNPYTFEPSIGFKTRYGMLEHPFSGSSYLSSPSADGAHQNAYYRVSLVNNLI